LLVSELEGFLTYFLAGVALFLISANILTSLKSTFGFDHDILERRSCRLVVLGFSATPSSWIPSSTLVDLSEI